MKRDAGGGEEGKLVELSPYTQESRGAAPMVIYGRLEAG